MYLTKFCTVTGKVLCIMFCKFCLNWLRFNYFIIKRVGLQFFSPTHCSIAGPKVWLYTSLFFSRSRKDISQPYQGSTFITLTYKDNTGPEATLRYASERD